MKFYASVLFGALSCLLFFEGALRFLPVNSGVRLEPTSEISPYVRYVPKQHYTYSHGWSFLNGRSGVTSREGFVNTHDFSDTGKILVIGDSFIEAFMLPYSETLQGQLESIIGERVYAAAASGNGLADTVELMHHFVPRLAPRAIVIFVKPQELSKLLAPPNRGHSGFFASNGSYSIKHQPYIESKYKILLSNSALIRYFYYNLKFPDWLSMVLKNAEKPSGGVHSNEVAAVLDFYFHSVKKALLTDSTPVIFLIDGDRASLYSGRTSDDVLEQRQLVAEFELLARRNGFGVVSMAPYFSQHWANYHERMDSLPADGHWNKVGHGLAAKAIADWIKLH